MSATYKAVSWTPDKKRYDLVLLALVLGFVGLFVGVGFATHPQATVETMLIRAFGTAAALLLHLILCIGPLARLDSRFLPLLYNRRHLGVTMAILALAHGLFSLVQFHALGNVNPLVSVLTSNGNYDSVSQFPFQTLGLVALVIVVLMAATSHDFWLANLTAPTWKALHMLVYVAYALVLLHVALGVLQDERQLLLTALVFASAINVGTLHVLAALREASPAHVLEPGTTRDHWVHVGSVDDIEIDRARIIELAGERVAVFRYRASTESGPVERVAAVSNVCQHQNGPLGEGKVVDGCITCPWHGFQYRPEDGASPPPFTEKIPTFRVRLEQRDIWIDPKPLPAGTPTDPAEVRA